MTKRFADAVQAAFNKITDALATPSTDPETVRAGCTALRAASYALEATHGVKVDETDVDEVLRRTGVIRVLSTARSGE